MTYKKKDKVLKRISFCLYKVVKKYFFKQKVTMFSKTSPDEATPTIKGAIMNLNLLPHILRPNPASIFILSWWPIYLLSEFSETLNQKSTISNECMIID
jgi:hypothetical protein